MAGTVLFSPVCALLSARCTPELERVQAELGARTSFRDGVRILEALLPVSPANHESLRSRTHAVALQLEAADRQAAAKITAVRDDTAKAAAADASRPVAPLDLAQIDVERLRHLLWSGHHEKACEALGRIASWAKDAVVPNEPVAEATVRRLAARCAELRRYIENNEGALIDYGQRYRAGKPISTSRAESTVNQLVNARMNKRRQMRWSPRGAHRVLQVRAAVLDGRFGHQALQLAA